MKKKMIIPGLPDPVRQRDPRKLTLFPPHWQPRLCVRDIILINKVLNNVTSSKNGHCLHSVSRQQKVSGFVLWTEQQNLFLPEGAQVSSLGSNYLKALSVPFRLFLSSTDNPLNQGTNEKH